MQVYQLLKDHGCASTFTFHEEFQSAPILAGSCFYQPEQGIHSDRTQKEWREEVDAKLDVCVPTKKAFSEREEIRFDIDWSQKAKLYSMYVSLPTSARSKSLTRKLFKKQDELIAEVRKWLSYAGCKKIAKSHKPKHVEIKLDQLSLF